MDIVTFSGRPGWVAISTDPTGANLPEEYGPWTALGIAQALDDGVADALVGKGYILFSEVDELDDVLAASRDSQSRRLN